MTIKRAVGKAVVGVVLAVVGVAGVVVGQTVIHPNVTGSQPNAVAEGDVKKMSADLPILFEVQKRAIIYARSPITAANPLTTGLDLDNTAWDITSHSTGDVIGNAGYIFVETNYSAWDVLVRRENAGYLLRQGSENDPDAETVGGYNSSVCVPDPTPIGPWDSPLHDICTNVTTGGTMGVPLKFSATPGAVPAKCPLKFAVGIIDAAALTTATLPQIPTVISDATNVVAVDELSFTTPNETYASFASSLTAEIADIATSTASVYFADDWDVLATTGMVGTTGVFPTLAGGPKLGLDVLVEDPYTETPKPNVNDYSIAFYINAKLDIPAGGGLSGNRNGIYEEYLRFTFYALY